MYSSRHHFTLCSSFFRPFPLCQTSPILQVRLLPIQNVSVQDYMHMTFDPYDFEDDVQMKPITLQGRAGYD